MNHPQVKDLVLDLARARMTKDQCTSKIARLKAEISDTPIGKMLFDAQAEFATAEEKVVAADTALREGALAEYSITQNKRLHSAVTVKIFTVLKYGVAAAIAEAIKHFQWTLKLDKRKFDKIARDADFDFVTKHADPRVSISRDLSPYLEEWEASETLAREQARVQEQADLAQAKTEADFVTDLFGDS